MPAPDDASDVGGASSAAKEHGKVDDKSHARLVDKSVKWTVRKWRPRREG